VRVGGLRAPGLSEDAKGWAAVGEGKLRWLGAPTIVAELERLYEDWVGEGCPRIEEYEIRFVPLADGRDLRVGGWIIDRLFFRECISKRIAYGPEARSRASAQDCSFFN
jgi:hypothetical protein